MTRNSIRKEIENQIKDFSHKETIYFAWLCAVRALPFLSVKRNFAYWREPDRQKYLLSVFHAIDKAAADTDDTVSVASTVALAKANTKAAATVKTNIRKDTRAADAAASDAARAADYAADDRAAAIARASHTVLSIVADAGAYATKAATKAAARAADDAALAAANREFVDIIFSDIETIREKGQGVHDSNIIVYGEIWHHFLDDLREMGCGYWANLYEDLFKSGFDLNAEELKRRLSVPDEIKAQGVAVIGHYLDNLGDETERLNEARVIILGQKGAGKTSIARKLENINAPMPKKNESTPGVSVLHWKLEADQDGDDMNVHIWDFAGHTITHAAHRCFMSSRCLYIYVYDGRGEHVNRPDYWLEQIKIYGGQSPVLFLINETDGHKPDIGRKTLKDKYPSIVDYFSFDIRKDKTKLKSFRKDVANLLRNNPAWDKQEISADAYQIKEDLRAHFKNSRTDHITREQFDKIAKKTNASPEMYEQILADLHTLGICLWYNTKDMLDFNALVLNPDWITNGIYMMINWGDKNERHIISTSDRSEIFTGKDKSRYPIDNVRFLFKLMNVYELAFFKGKRIFVPILLPPDRPDDLPDFPDGERLTMCFRVEKALPPNVVSRLIVRHNEEIGGETEVWRKGAVLRYRDGNAIALIVEDERSILVRVKGPDKTSYIAHLRDTLVDIFESYREMHHDLCYEVFVPEESPIMLTEKTILTHLSKNHPYLDEGSGKFVSLVMIDKYYDLRKIDHGLVGPELQALLVELIAEIRNYAWESPDEFKAIAESLKTIESELKQQNEKSPSLLAKTLSAFRAVNDTTRFGTTVHSFVQSLQTFLETCPTSIT